MTQISNNKRYHALYDNQKYLAIRAQVEQDLDHNQDSIFILMNLLIDLCIETSRGMVTNKLYALAHTCLPLNLGSVHQLTDYVTSFEIVGSGGVGADIYLLVQVYQKLNNHQQLLQEVGAISGNIYGGRGQQLHHLLRASNDLVNASIALLESHHATYVATKIEQSIVQLDYALKAGLADSSTGTAYDFSAHQFPQAEAKEEN